MSRLVFLDSTIVITLAGKPCKYPDGRQRAICAISKHREKKDHVVLAAPALAECVSELKSKEEYRIYPLDHLAALEAHRIWQFLNDLRKKGKIEGATKHQVSVDALILGVAISRHADILYTTDTWFFGAARDLNLPIRIQDLPEVPAESKQLSLELDEPQSNVIHLPKRHAQVAVVSNCQNDSTAIADIVLANVASDAKGNASVQSDVVDAELNQEAEDSTLSAEDNSTHISQEKQPDAETNTIDSDKTEVVPIAIKAESSTLLEAIPHEEEHDESCVDNRKPATSAVAENSSLDPRVIEIVTAKAAGETRLEISGELLDELQV